jgi:hypothetical protein
MDRAPEQANAGVFDFTFAAYSEGAGSISLRASIGEAAIDKVAADVLDCILVR